MIELVRSIVPARFMPPRRDPRRKPPLYVAGHFEAECIRRGRRAWLARFPNLIPDAALNDALDVWLSGGSQDTTLFVGLKGTGSVASGDTMASHAGWSELTDYDEAARQAWVDGGVSGKSVSNAGSPAAFTINDTVEFFGAFITGENTKGGSTGVLYAAGDFASSRELEDGDTLLVTYTLNSSDDGI